TLQDVTAVILSSWSGTLVLDGGAVEVGGAAAGSFTIDGGRMAWRSTGNPGATLAVGSGGVLDLTQAPATLTFGGTIQAYAGCVINDSAGRGGNPVVKTVRCTLQEIDWRTPNDKTYTPS
ncbi:MAG TPA: hypothetical protein VD866_02690, partial [Urbifossiella sp.]|nr:hypothetical protein [Urbifossiella sp.]